MKRKLRMSHHEWHKWATATYSECYFPSWQPSYEIDENCTHFRRLQSTLNPYWTRIDAIADGKRPFLRWMYGSKGGFRNYSIIGNHYVKFPPEPFSCRSLWNLTALSVKNNEFGWIWTCSDTAKEFAKKLWQTFLHFLIQEANLSCQSGSGGLEIDIAGNKCPCTKHWFLPLGVEAGLYQISAKVPSGSQFLNHLPSCSHQHHHPWGGKTLFLLPASSSPQRNGHIGCSSNPPDRPNRCILSISSLLWIFPREESYISRLSCTHMHSSSMSPLYLQPLEKRQLSCWTLEVEEMVIFTGGLCLSQTSAV